MILLFLAHRLLRPFLMMTNDRDQKRINQRALESLKNINNLLSNLAHLRSVGWAAEAGYEQWRIYPPGRYAQQPTCLEKVINTFFGTCLNWAAKN